VYNNRLLSSVTTQWDYGRRWPVGQEESTKRQERISLPDSEAKARDDVASGLSGKEANRLPLSKPEVFAVKKQPPHAKPQAHKGNPAERCSIGRDQRSKTLRAVASFPDIGYVLFLDWQVLPFDNAVQNQTGDSRHRARSDFGLGEENAFASGHRTHSPRPPAMKSAHAATPLVG
jgi:hypothetical protein